MVIPVRLELTTPPLKVECSKPTELRDLLFVILVTFHNTCFYLFIYSRIDRTRTDIIHVPNVVTYQLVNYPMLEEEVGVDPNTRQGTARFQNGVTGRCNSSSI